MSYDQGKDEYTASGNVSIHGSRQQLTADYVRYDRALRRVFASGHVTAKMDGDTVTADRVELDLEKEIGTIYQGGIDSTVTNFHIRADEINKTGPATYTARKATVTTCDGDDPDWKMTCSDMEVTVEGYGIAHEAALWGRQIPLFYSPILPFPAKTKRQTGLLIPEIRYADRKGLDVNQPFFWAIDDNMDATLYVNAMSERGNRIGSEYRYVFSEETKGAVMLDLLRDRKVDDGSGETSEDWGYTEDAYLRTNSDRYWFRMKHDQDFGHGVKAKLDLDLVSDQDYLLEFEDGYNGFRATQEYFVGTYGRGLDEYNQTTRKNQLNVNKTWTLYSFDADLLWKDDVVKRRWEQTDDTMQELPHLRFSGLKHQMPGANPLFWDLSSEYIYFYSKDSDRGQRAEMYPRVYAPLSYRNYVSFEPSVGLRETVWQVNAWEEGADSTRSSFHRQLYDLKLDLSTEVYRIFTMNQWGLDRLKHSIRPQIVYDYIPEEDQSRYPQFDAFDRIEKQNRITYAITNMVTSRKPFEPAQRPDHEASVAGVPRNFAYSQFCYFRLSQSYDINEARDAEEPEPFSAVTGTLELQPVPAFGLRVDLGWDPYTRRFDSHSETVMLTAESGHRIYAEFRQAEEISKSILMMADFILTDRFSTYGKYERNLKDGKNIETGIGLRYTTQCWGLDVSGMRREDDAIYRVMIELYGLGQAGTSIAAPY
ncbi:MAG: LPS-assembly protein LptD [Thermodesulfobacteriota bacterium]